MMHEGKPWVLAALVLAATFTGRAEETSPQATAAAKAETDDEPQRAAKPPNPGEGKFWSAMKHFRGKTPADVAAGRADLEQAAAGEYTPAQLVLGEYYQSGENGFARDPKKGTAYYRLAAERGNAFAKVSYGLCLFSGVGVRKDADAAAVWLEAALAPGADFAQPRPPADFFGPSEVSADEGVAGMSTTDAAASARAKAHYILGVICDSRKKPAEAQAHYVAAAAGHGGIQQAAIQAAVNYALGHGVPRDAARANELLTQARTLVRRMGISMVHSYASAKLVDDFAISELEEAVAEVTDTLEGDLQLNIARQFTDKKSTDYNPKEAVRWFELAAESGKAWAMLELAFLYSGDDLGPPDPGKAFAWFEKVGGGDVPKHDLGVANLIICYQHGIGILRDEAKARTLATKHREDELVSHLTLMGQCPAAVITYERRVELNRLWAGERKDAQAQYLLGIRYENGWGVDKDLETAAKWYRKAARAHHGAACWRLGRIYEEHGDIFSLYGAAKWERAVEWYRDGAEAKDAGATAQLAYLTASGRGVKANEEAAKALYERTLQLDPNHEMALNNLGAIYEERFLRAVAAGQEGPARVNRELMRQFYERGEKAGSYYAPYNLGRLYADGSMGERDLQKAYACFELAAERGHREARFRLGQMHEHGEGVPVTPVEAAYHYRLAALDGHTEALQRLVTFYLEGKGGTQDLERAQFWLVKLYQQGRIGALAVFVDVALQQGRYTEAVEVLEDLKESGSRELSGFAYERLSRCYRAGLGVKAKPARASAYRDKAIALGNADAVYDLAKVRMAEGKVPEALELFAKASSGSPHACYALGQMHYFGQHVPRDLAKAVGYLRKAAELNHREAQYFLAGLTFNKVEGAPTLDEAIQFARSAEALGQPKAGALREKLESRRRSQGIPSQETTGTRST